MYAETLHAHVRCGRRRSSAPSLGRKVEARLFHLFGGKVMRFSDLERAIPNITQKMLGQQLRSLAADGIVVRTAYPQVPPKVEYCLTPWGQSLCPTLDAIMKWADRRPAGRRSATRPDRLRLLNHGQA